MKVYALKKIRFIHSNKQIPEDEDAYNQPVDLRTPKKITTKDVFP